MAGTCLHSACTLRSLRMLLLFVVVLPLLVLMLGFSRLKLHTSFPTLLPVKTPARRDIQPPRGSGVPTSDGEFLKRKQRYEAACKSTGLRNNAVERVMVHKPTKTIYCYVPKAGCTFWKRVFSFVNGKSESIFSTSRYDIHYSMKLTMPYKTGKHGPDKYQTRFMVVRDPLSRILSSYLDKLYLPDFWHKLGAHFENIGRLTNTRRESSAGKSISKNNSTSTKDTSARLILERYKKKFNITLHHERGSQEEDFLKNHLKAMSSMFKDVISQQNSSAKGKTHACGKTVTFAEFVRASLQYEENHWAPTHAQCNPCHFRPTHVSLMSTFSSDAKVIMSALGHQHALDYFDADLQINEELWMIVGYFFTIEVGKRKQFLKPCLSPHELAYRLWQNFVWRGYIHPRAIYSVPSELGPLDFAGVKEDLLEQLKQARSRGLEDRAAMAQAKRAFFRDAISSLTEEELLALIQKYTYDYLYFDVS